MFAQDQHLRELPVVMGLRRLVSAGYHWQVTVCLIAWLGFPSVSLAPLFPVRLRLTNPLSQLSLSQPFRALPSVVKTCRLVGE
jgi:hypothetical protein